MTLRRGLRGQAVLVVLPSHLVKVNFLLLIKAKMNKETSAMPANLPCSALAASSDGCDCVM